jgi:hypothetical protein
MMTDIQSMIYIFVAMIAVVALAVYAIVNPMPRAFVEKVDRDGVVWVKLTNVTENTSIYVYYGDNVSNKQMWILK